MQAVFEGRFDEGRLRHHQLWNTNHRPERVKPTRRQPATAAIDTVDCYIIHTPFAFQPGDEQEPFLLSLTTPCKRCGIT